MTTLRGACASGPPTACHPGKSLNKRAARTETAKGTNREHHSRRKPMQQHRQRAEYVVLVDARTTPQARHPSSAVHTSKRTPTRSGMVRHVDRSKAPRSTVTNTPRTKALRSCRHSWTLGGRTRVSLDVFYGARLSDTWSPTDGTKRRAQKS